MKQFQVFNIIICSIFLGRQTTPHINAQGVAIVISGITLNGSTQVRRFYNDTLFVAAEDSVIFTGKATKTYIKNTINNNLQVLLKYHHLFLN